MSSLLTFLLLSAADPAAAAAPQRAAAPAATPAVAPAPGPDDDCDGRAAIAITEQGIPAAKEGGKDDRPKKTLIKASPQFRSAAPGGACPAGGPGDSDSDGDGAARAAAPGDNTPIVKGRPPAELRSADAACAAEAKIIVDTYGGHGAHGGQGMAINEQGVQTKPKKKKAVAAAASSSSSSASGGACPVPAGMAINEKGVPKKRTQKNQQTTK